VFQLVIVSDVVLLLFALLTIILPSASVLQVLMRAILMISSKAANRFPASTTMTVHRPNSVTALNTNATMLAQLIHVETTQFASLKIIRQTVSVLSASSRIPSLMLNVHKLKHAMPIYVIQQQSAKQPTVAQCVNAHRIILETLIQQDVACKLKETVHVGILTAPLIRSANKENVSTHVLVLVATMRFAE
jgi:hypothetical protein